MGIKRAELKGGQRMRAYVFPGQGAQVVGMGKELFQKYPHYVRVADEVLGYSIEELCLEDKESKLNLTQYTQPALFVVSALSYLDAIEKEGRKPEVVAGHSLGEYNALFAAGAFSFETGVRLVKKRGELMGNANGGAMAAIVGLTEQKVREVIKTYHLNQVDISNLNTPKQTVIASTKDGIECAKAAFEQEQARVIPLKVSAAFHSRYMKEAQEKFDEYLEQFKFSKLQIPVISNYTASTYQEGEVKRNLIQQLGSTVRWVESVKRMEELGCTEIVEVGPGHVLTNMIKKIRLEEKALRDEQGSTSETGGTNKTSTTEAASPFEIVDAWNKKFPVGTMVTCKGYPKPLQTRTQAVVLFHHRPAIYMEGYKGYFDLTEITPVN